MKSTPATAGFSDRPDLRNYFESQPWYRPRSDNAYYSNRQVEAELTSYREKKHPDHHLPGKCLEEIVTLLTVGIKEIAWP